MTQSHDIESMINAFNPYEGMNKSDTWCNFLENIEHEKT